MKYFTRYLKVAPVALAIWRAREAERVDQVSCYSPVLDIGCGFGEFAGVLDRFLIEVGVDLSLKDVVRAAHQKKYNKLIHADARDIPLPDNSFNTIFSISTLEHISEVEKVFGEVRRLLSPGGQFVFTVPTNQLNSMLIGAKWFKKIGFGAAADFYIRSFHHVFKHVNIWPMEKWIDLTVQNGLKIKKIEPTLTNKQLNLFELFLLSSLPTQLTRKLIGKRLIYSPDFRVNSFDRLFSKIWQDENYNNANILIVAEK